jgi:hypothetical protein
MCILEAQGEGALITGVDMLGGKGVDRSSG